MSEVESKVVDIVVEQLGVAKSQVTMDASYTADLNADSIDVVEMVMAFEKEFGIQISDDATQKISTVGDTVAYITEALKNK